MKNIKVPCSECGNMITMVESRKGQKNYCDKFCKSRAEISKLRGSGSAVNKPKRLRRLRCCGG